MQIRREADRDREFRERQEELLRRMEGAGAAARVPLVPPRPGGLDRDAVLRALDDALRAATDEVGNDCHRRCLPIAIRLACRQKDPPHAALAVRG